MEVKGIGQGGQITFNTPSKADSQSDGQVSSDRIDAISKNSDDNIRNNIKSGKTEKLREEDVSKAVEKLNKFLEDNKTHAEYEVHDKLKDLMIKIVDDKTGKVIQEIPPKKILDMVAKMLEMVGIIVDKKA